jgi:hypothetical protein
MLELGAIVRNPNNGRMYSVLGHRAIRTIYGQTLMLQVEDCMGNRSEIIANTLELVTD